MACSLGLVGSFAALLLSFAASAHCRDLQGAKDHRYKVNDDVPLWASKVGPFANPRYLLCALAKDCTHDPAKGRATYNAVKHMNTTSFPTANRMMESSIKRCAWERYELFVPRGPSVLEECMQLAIGHAMNWCSGGRCQQDGYYPL